MVGIRFAINLRVVLFFKPAIFATGTADKARWRKDLLKLEPPAKP